MGGSLGGVGIWMRRGCGEPGADTGVGAGAGGGAVASGTPGLGGSAAFGGAPRSSAGMTSWGRSRAANAGSSCATVDGSETQWRAPRTAAGRRVASPRTPRARVCMAGTGRQESAAAKANVVARPRFGRLGALRWAAGHAGTAAGAALAGTTGLAASNRGRFGRG